MTERAINSRRRFLHGSLVVAGAAAANTVWVPRAHAAKHKMLFAHTFTEASEKYVVTGIKLFKELAEKYSDGALLVDIHEGGKLGGQTELPQKVQYGAIQACQVSAQNFTPYAEVFNLLDLPFLFPSNNVFNQFLGSPEFARSKLAKEPEQKGLKVLSGMWANTGLRVLCISKRAKRQVKIPRDLDGIKLRVTNSKIEQQTFGLTRAGPVSINWAETYQAMQQGAVDGLHVGLGPLSANRLQEVVSTGTRLNMSFNAHVTMVSRKWFEQLPASIQSAITRAAAESWEYQQREQAIADARMWSDWKQLGIEILDLSGAEHAQWVEAVGHQRPEWNRWKDRYGRDTYEQILAFVRKNRA